MEKKESMYNKLNDLMNVTLGELSENPEYNAKTKDILKEYKDYSIYDLFVLAKIDILLMDECISQETHDNLINLYKTYIGLLLVASNIEKDDKLSDCISERVERISDLFYLHGLSDDGLYDLLTDNDYVTQYSAGTEKEIEDTAKRLTRVRIVLNTDN